MARLFDVPSTPFDFDVDSRSDLALFRSVSSTWFYLRSSNLLQGGAIFGTDNDLRTPADFTGDGRFDAAVYRPLQATWFVNQSSAGIVIRPYGLTGDLPVAAAYIR